MADYGTYASPAELKTLLKIVDTTDDAELLRHLAMASRTIDRYCGRWFYVKTDTRYPVATGGRRLNLGADLLVVTTIKTDEDLDATYENTLATTDYALYPYADNEFPKLQAEIDTRQGDYYYWPKGLKSVQIPHAGFYNLRTCHRPKRRNR